MVFAPLYIYFKDEKINVFRKKPFDKWKVPRGEYVFIESYCADKDCDCRKVIINIADKKVLIKFWRVSAMAGSR